MKIDNILIIGACGQMGTALTKALQLQHGKDNVIITGLYPNNPIDAHYTCLDVLNQEQVRSVVKEYSITHIYMQEVMICTAGEEYVNAAWTLNMRGLINVLETAREEHVDKVFWPGSIAVFGPGSPKYLCPQDTQMEPHSVYGISKRTGEFWCNYYFDKYGLDVRSLRYPGLISHSALQGGSVTDYVFDLFHAVTESQPYTCFLKEDTCLPMLYVDDAVRATVELMNAPKENIKIRTSYNIAGMSFAPCDLVASISKHGLKPQISYEPDYRQAIADSWPASISDKEARRDWGWKSTYNLERVTDDMLKYLTKQQQEILIAVRNESEIEFYPHEAC